MNFKKIQGQLKLLRDRIKDQGAISADDEQELKSLIRQTLENANDELVDINTRLKSMTGADLANDNRNLSEEQKAKLDIVEKTGTGSVAIH